MLRVGCGCDRWEVGVGGRSGGGSDDFKNTTGELRMGKRMYITASKYTTGVWTKVCSAMAHPRLTKTKGCQGFGLLPFGNIKKCVNFMT